MGKCIGLTTFLLILVFVSVAQAHPGRLDRDRGHWVRKSFSYKDGTYLEKGTYHYHQWSKSVGLGDGRFMLIGGKDDKKGNAGNFVGGFDVRGPTGLGSNSND